MEMQLKEESRRVLEILAREYESTPGTKYNGISEEVLGARAGCYLNMSYKAIAELRRAKLVSQLPNNNVILTEKGYEFAKSTMKRRLNLPKVHPILLASAIVGIVAGLIAIIYYLVNLSK